MKDDFVSALHSVTAFAKVAFNYVMAALGVSSALGYINLTVGIASALWLSVQIYTHLKYDRPMKKMKKALLQKQVNESITDPAALGIDS